MAIAKDTTPPHASTEKEKEKKTAYLDCLHSCRFHLPQSFKSLKEVEHYIYLCDKYQNDLKNGKEDKIRFQRIVQEGRLTSKCFELNNCIDLGRSLKDIIENPPKTKNINNESLQALKLAVGSFIDFASSSMDGRSFDETNESERENRIFSFDDIIVLTLHYANQNKNLFDPKLIEGNYTDIREKITNTPKTFDLFTNEFKLYHSFVQLFNSSKHYKYLKKDCDSKKVKNKGKEIIYVKQILESCKVFITDNLHEQVDGIVKKKERDFMVTFLYEYFSFYNSVPPKSFQINQFNVNTDKKEPEESSNTEKGKKLRTNCRKKNEQNGFDEELGLENDIEASIPVGESSQRITEEQAQVLELTGIETEMNQNQLVVPHVEENCLESVTQNKTSEECDGGKKKVSKRRKTVEKEVNEITTESQSEFEPKKKRKKTDAVAENSNLIECESGYDSVVEKPYENDKNKIVDEVAPVKKRGRGRPKKSETQATPKKNIERRQSKRLIASSVKPIYFGPPSTSRTRPMLSRTPPSSTTPSTSRTRPSSTTPSTSRSPSTSSRTPTKKKTVNKTAKKIKSLPILSSRNDASSSNDNRNKELSVCITPKENELNGLTVKLTWDDIKMLQTHNFNSYQQPSTSREIYCYDVQELANQVSKKVVPYFQRLHSIINRNTEYIFGMHEGLMALQTENIVMVRDYIGFRKKLPEESEYIDKDEDSDNEHNNGDDGVDNSDSDDDDDHSST